MNINNGSLNVLGSERNRSYEISLKDINDKNISIGIQDIDESIKYYFDNVIKPTVNNNGAELKVPVIYGAQERWKSVQQDGFYRDKNGKIELPLIMFQRKSIQYDRSVGFKLDGNAANNIMVVQSRWSKRNVYDNLYVLNKQAPQYETYLIVIPDYVTITYNCIVLTNYTQHNNDIIEPIIFANNSYWGDPKKYIFRARCETYNHDREIPDNRDLVVRTTFDLTLNGYIIPNSINKELATLMNKYYNITKVSINMVGR